MILMAARSSSVRFVVRFGDLKTRLCDFDLAATTRATEPQLWRKRPISFLHRAISRQTVEVILKENDLDPGPRRGEGTWDEFLQIHAQTLWQCDFVTKPMWTRKGLVDLYCLVFLHLGTRRCWISPCTVSPDSAWVTRQSKNFVMEAKDQCLPAKIVMRDNDGKYTAASDHALKESGIRVMRNLPRSPNLRAHVERFIQSLKVECLDRFMVVGERHLNFINREWRIHYNQERPHEARGHLPPDFTVSPSSVSTAQPRDIVCTTRLGGLLRSYGRRAA
jgi:putative transposase